MPGQLCQVQIFFNMEADIFLTVQNLRRAETACKAVIVHAGDKILEAGGVDRGQFKAGLALFDHAQILSAQLVRRSRGQAALYGCVGIVGEEDDGEILHVADRISNVVYFRVHLCIIVIHGNQNIQISMSDSLDQLGFEFESRVRGVGFGAVIGCSACGVFIVAALVFISYLETGFRGRSQTIITSIFWMI